MSSILLNKVLSDADFHRLSEYIYVNYGIKMPISKKVMLQARLQARLRATGIDSFADYVDFVFSEGEGEQEIVKMIDVVSTNKTDFFRESKHFDYMRDAILPGYENTELKVWSSAASSGEESYSIAITIEEFMRTGNKIDYSVFGTDISTRILERAINGIYAEERIETVDLEIKRRYFLKSKNRESQTVRVIPELRKRTSFGRLNLMDDHYIGVPLDFDMLFCRNVLIYFDRQTQQKVISKLCNHLKTGGYFFLGHSESLTGFNLPLKQVAPTIFKKI